MNLPEDYEDASGTPTSKMNFLGQGFPKLQHYEQTDTAQKLPCSICNSPRPV